MATITGRATDARTGRGLADCVVTASNDKGEIETVVTDEHGRFAFTFEAHEPNEGWRYALRFERAGYHPTTIDGVTSGDHEFKLEPVVDPGLARARTAYAAYGRTTDFKNFRGEPMPEFDALPETIQRAWVAAAAAVTCDHTD